MRLFAVKPNGDRREIPVPPGSALVDVESVALDIEVKRGFADDEEIIAECDDGAGYRFLGDCWEAV